MNRTTKENIKLYFLSFVFVLMFITTTFLVEWSCNTLSPFAQVIMVSVSLMVIVGMTIMLCSVGKDD